MHLVENADSKIHEWLGKIDHLLSLWGYGKAGDCQVCFLQQETNKQTKTDMIV